MYRGTTPTHTFTLPDEISPSSIKELRISYAQGCKEIFSRNVSTCSFDGQTITIKLTQEETLSFRANIDVQIQLRLLLTDGTALVSEMITRPLNICLNEEVLE